LGSIILPRGKIEYRAYHSITARKSKLEKKIHFSRQAAKVWDHNPAFLFVLFHGFNSEKFDWFMMSAD
jgi:hypothetical protein